MELSDSAHDAVLEARERYFALREQCDALEAQLTPGATPAHHDGDASADTRLPARLAALRRARDDAHATLGRALLERFASEVKQVTAGTRRLWRQGAAADARESAIVEDIFRRSCLSALAGWPALAEEARRRLAPPPGDGPVLH